MKRTIRLGLAVIGLVAGVAGVQTMFAQQGGPGGGGWGNRGGRHGGPPNPQAVVRFSCSQIGRIAKQLGNLNLSDDTTGLKNVVSGLIVDLGPAKTQCESLKSLPPPPSK
jgi:hypothetical protein